MNILIDARLYGLQHRGIGRYIMELVHGLATDPGIHHYSLLVQEGDQSLFTNIGSFFNTYPVQARIYSIKEQWEIPNLINRLKPDLVHFPHFSAPFFCPRPFVITIHDLILHHMPTERASTLPGPFYWSKILAYRVLLRRLTKQAACIITVSQTVANDISQYYPDCKDKIKVIKLAPTKLPKIKKFKSDKPYLLMVGAMYPHKNIENCVRAVALLRKKIPDLELWLVSKEDFFSRRLNTELKVAGYDKWVKQITDVSDSELASLYRGCLVYLILSFQEGFGLGAVEALSQQAIVVASDIPVLKEILGQAAIYAKPEEPMAIAQAVEKSLLPAIRKELSFQTNKILKTYSWQETVKQTKLVYESCQNKLRSY